MTKKEKVYFWPQWLEKICPDKRKTKSDLLNQLGQSQIYLWRALNIYDDFFDNKGKLIKLPLANSYLRKFITIHYNLKLAPDFYLLLNQLMTNLENANQREIRTQRLKVDGYKITIPEKLPSFSKLTTLSDKSLVLALGPIAFLAHQGYKMIDPKIGAIINFFRYALTAKQLSDDAKDWLEDLKNGVITVVNTPILRELKQKNLVLDLKNDLEAILIEFSRIAPKIAQNIIDLCLLARKEITKINSNKNCCILREIIEPLEKTAKKSLKFQQLLLENNY